jgi:putative transposase
MILTFKVKHKRDFFIELRKARQIAEFALKTKTQSSKDVKQFGLKSVISNQILREFSRNKRLKRVGSVNLIVPNASIKRESDRLYIPCLKLVLPIIFRNDFSKVNQIELDKEYAYISVTIPESEMKVVSNYIGVDRNATGHIAVVANPSTGKVFKLGKSAQHTHNKYRNIRRTLQKYGKYAKLKTIKDRESRIVRDINHKISKKIVDIAESSNSGIKLERLKGIRNSRHHGRGFNGTLHSWGFYQLENFIAYKAKMRGIPLAYVEPRNTSKECSRCGNIGTRQGKKFVCHLCGHIENADVNASFNIALRPNISQSTTDRDVMEGCSDTPKTALARTMSTVEPHGL